MPEQVSSEISNAVYKTLLYSDIFDFPLTAREVHRYLSGSAVAYEDIVRALRSDPRFMGEDGYFFLTGREEIVTLRREREARSKKLFPYALAYGRIIGSLPFVRMVALTGSLAVHNVSRNEDFDYMLVTEPGRLWTARAFVVLFGRLARLTGHTICPNVLISQAQLEWSQQDMYSARDLCQMVPIVGMKVYRKLILANRWVKGFLPNAYEDAVHSSLNEKRNHIVQRLLEFPLRGRLGNWFERWEMQRKIERFSRQEGFGEETVFNANICQGNFDHHRRRIRQKLEHRGRTLTGEAFVETVPAETRTV